MKVNETNKKIISILFFLNVFFLLLSIFYISKLLIISFFLLNIILLGTNLIIRKYLFIFEGLLMTNKIARKLNNSLTNLD